MHDPLFLYNVNIITYSLGIEYIYILYLPIIYTLRNVTYVFVYSRTAWNIIMKPFIIFCHKKYVAFLKSISF